jgi:nucleotide-binding universal stress UspA family protein
MSNTIVVGYIPSPEGDAAMGRAIREAVAHQAKLVAVNVIHDDGSTIDNRYVQGDVSDELRKRLEESEIEFQMIKTEAPNVSDAILETAEKHNAETIVLGLRRRSRVGKLILGSIAQRVLMDADTSVLVVRAEEEQDS